MSEAGAAARLFRSRDGAHLFMADGSRIYDLQEAEAARIGAGLAGGDAAVLAPYMLREPCITLEPVRPPPWRAVSLNIAQSCNMSCGYCYADEGRFGGRARMMARDIARATAARLIEDAAPGDSIVIGFMGGEPLLNRDVLHDCVRHAEALAAPRGVRVRFSLTTNATLITPEDARLFAEHHFTVTVSIDGAAAQNDRQRPMHDGSGSHARVLRGLDIMAQHGRPAHLAARITATAGLNLRAALDHLLGLGFDGVGFSGAITSRNEALRLHGDAALAYRDGLLACGEHALAELLAGRRYPFSNLLVALEELHRGTHRPYPCGAGAAYLSADAEGGLHACHRLVDSPGFDMGNISSGPDESKRAALLARQHVDRMEPCRSCWARYLCGGGCYHEVAAHGRDHCDTIRAWLEFCLRAYAELSVTRPEMFS